MASSSSANVPELVELSWKTLDETHTSSDEEILNGSSQRGTGIATRAKPLPPPPRPVTKFWTTNTAFFCYGVLALCVLTGQFVWMNILGFMVVRGIGNTFSKWGFFLSQDSESKAAMRALRNYWKLLMHESEKVVNGNFSRQVAAAYLIHACTAPGESYISYLIRYKMSMLNNLWLDDLREWNERRLGYEPSSRNLMP